MSNIAFAPVNPAQRRSGTPIAKSHHESESAERAASPIAFVIAPGRPPLRTASSVLSALLRAERASEDQAERQQPQEYPVGEAPGENARRDAAVPLHRADRDRERDVPFARALRARVAAVTRTCAVATGGRASSASRGVESAIRLAHRSQRPEARRSDPAVPPGSRIGAPAVSSCRLGLALLATLDEVDRRQRRGRDQRGDDQRRERDSPASEVDTQ